MLLLCLLLIVLVTLSIVSILKLGRSILSPGPLFLGGFSICAFMTLLMSPRWDYEMSLNAFFVITLGCLVFAACDGLTFKLLQGKEWMDGVRVKSATNPILFKPMQYNRGVLAGMVILSILTSALVAIEIMNNYPADSLPGSIAIYNSIKKFSDQGVQQFKFPINILQNLSSMMGFIFAYVAAQEVIAKKRSGAILAAAGMIATTCGQLLIGSRTSALEYFVCFGVSFYLLKRYKNGGGRVITKKIALLLVGVVALFILTFESVASVLQGRSTATDHITYFSAYIGAQIPNFDYFLNNVGQQDTGIFGYMTFRNSIHWIGTHFNIPDFVYKFDLPFRELNGYSTGNVYTTFYAFFYDFGIVGVVALTALMAFVSRAVYEKAHRFESGLLNAFWLIVYAMIANTLMLSFFSNKFYEGILSINVIFQFGYLAIGYLIIFLVGTPATREIKMLISKLFEMCRSR